MITPKKRTETEGIHLYFRPDLEHTPQSAIEKEEKRKGGFHLGYHYILRRSGYLEQGIPIDTYASPDLDAYKTCVCILVTTEKLTAAQKLTLENLQKELDLKVV